MAALGLPAMMKLGLHLMLGAASSACGLAAVGLLLYANGPWALAATQLFAGVGFVAGLFCGGLHKWTNQRQHLHSAALPPEALAGLVRATVVSMSAGRSSAARTAPALAAVTPVPMASMASRTSRTPIASAKPLAPRQFASSAFGT